MAKLAEQAGKVDGDQQERDKQKLQQQQDQYQQLQRDLVDAISRLASLDEIRILLACGARADRPVTQGLHPIHYAAYQNFVPAVRLLILRGCDINAMDDNGYTPVHLAAERGYYDLLDFLIANGAKVRFTDFKKQSVSFSRAKGALCACSAANIFSRSTTTKTTNKWPALFAENNNSAQSVSSMADEPLSLALKRAHMECAELLLKNGADPNARYFMGSEINLISVLKISSLKMLLEYGAHPDSRDRTGLTPLMKAARHPQGYAAVKLLIDHGADVNDIAGERHDYRTVLHHSIFSGNLDLIRLLLTSGARYPELQFDKPSPLDIAIISGRCDIAKLLIEFDADVNMGSHTTIGQPLHTALTQWLDNKYAMVKLLLDSGANPNSCQTSSRNTGPPLHDYLHSTGRSSVLPSSSRRRCGDAHKQPYLDIELVRLLLMYGARIILKTPTQNPFGLVRALEKAQDDISLDILQLLIDAAEEIDWFMMSKVIYACLRRTNRIRTNELFDPSVAADMTPQLLANVLSDQFAHYHGLCESLIKLLNGGNSSSAVLTLKQISRINIRLRMSMELQLKGRQLIQRLSCLPLPNILIKYLLYQV